MQDAEALRDEEQIPDRVEERDRALDRGGGHGLALVAASSSRSSGQALLELVVALVEFGQFP